MSGLHSINHCHALYIEPHTLVHLRVDICQLDAEAQGPRHGAYWGVEIAMAKETPKKAAIC